MTEGDRRSALKIVLSYDGASFAGSQRQSGQRTVQGELERTLTRLSHSAGPDIIPVVMAGRTDAGVHAAGQVASAADVRPDLTETRLLRAINAHLGDDCAVVAVTRVGASFHARYDAKWREYRYRIWSGPPEPLAREHTWQRRAPIDADRMREAADRLAGRHDFASFAGDGDGMPSALRRVTGRGTIRTVTVSDIRTLMPWWAERPEGRLIEYRIAADGFLPHMVRNIAGVLVEIGQGRREINWIDRLLEAGDRSLAGVTAPPQGLTLWRVGYADDSPDTGA